MNVYPLLHNFAFSDFPTEQDAEYLRESGYDALMTLSKRHPADVVKEVFKEYRYCHMPDGRKIPTEEVAHCVKIVRTWLKAGHRVIVHCYGGRNRSGLVAASVLMDQLDITGAEAIKRIDAASRKRNGDPRALTNAHFRTFLEMS